jgi:hypothetical protein
MVEPASEIRGPSPRAVKMARVWLLLLGVMWLLVGLVSGTIGGSEFWGWPLVLIGFGIVHFFVALYASARIAVFFALIGP